MDFTLPRIVPTGAGGLAGQLSALTPSPPPQVTRPGGLRTPVSGDATGATLGAEQSGALGATGGAQGSAQGGAQGGAQGVAESFGALLAQALQDVNTLHHSADAEANKLAAGEPVDLHQVMIGMERANVAFGLTLQVRNKLLEAYQEVMRMTI